MRFVRKLVLLAMVAVAAMAVVAPSAFGQMETDLEAIRESTGVECPDVVVTGHEPTGGCPVHAMSDHPILLRQHVFGVESLLATCDSEFEGYVDRFAEGYGSHQHLTQGATGTCNREPCEEPSGEKKPWPGHGHENPESIHNDSPSFMTEAIRVEVCVSSVPNMSDSPHCNFEVPFRETEVKPQELEGHHYEGGEEGVELAGIGTAGFRCELVGHWLTEESGVREDTQIPSQGTDLEVLHTD